MSRILPYLALLAGLPGAAHTQTPPASGCNLAAARVTLARGGTPNFRGCRAAEVERLLAGSRYRVVKRSVAGTAGAPAGIVTGQSQTGQVFVLTVSGPAPSPRPTITPRPTPRPLATFRPQPTPQPSATRQPRPTPSSRPIPTPLPTPTFRPRPTPQPSATARPQPQPTPTFRPPPSPRPLPPPRSTPTSRPTPGPVVPARISIDGSPRSVEGGTLTFQIAREGGADRSYTVALAYSDPALLLDPPATIRLAPNIFAGPLTLTTRRGTAGDGDHVLQVRLVRVHGGAILDRARSARGTILDTPAPRPRPSPTPTPSPTQAASPTPAPTGTAATPPAVPTASPAGAPSEPNPNASEAPPSPAAPNNLQAWLAQNWWLLALLAALALAGAGWLWSRRRPAPGPVPAAAEAPPEAEPLAAPPTATCTIEPGPVALQPVDDPLGRWPEFAADVTIEPGATHAPQPLPITEPKDG